MEYFPNALLHDDKYSMNKTNQFHVLLELTFWYITQTILLCFKYKMFPNALCSETGLLEDDWINKLQYLHWNSPSVTAEEVRRSRSLECDLEECTLVPVPPFSLCLLATVLWAASLHCAFLPSYFCLGAGQTWTELPEVVRQNESLLLGISSAMGKLVNTNTCCK